MYKARFISFSLALIAIIVAMFWGESAPLSGNAMIDYEGIIVEHTPVSAGIKINIDVSASRKPISPYIYGMNFAKASFADEIDLPVRRWGGNATSRYNWKTGNSNSALDWYFENSALSNPFNWNVTENHDQWIEQNILTGTDSIITIPMMGYASKDATSCGFNVDKYGAQQDADVWRPKCGNGNHLNNTPVTGNDPMDTSIVIDQTYIQAWLQDMVSKYGDSSLGGVKFYNLDNEPELWSETHRDVHPIHQSYDELRDKTILYANAIKSVDANAQTFGYASFGWTGYWYSWKDLQAAASNGYTYFPDYSIHGNKYQVEWYLSQIQQYERDNGIRLLDYLDLHYYQAGGVALTTAGDLNLQALRLRSTRALWDPAYRDESWIGGNDQPADWQKVRLIPRMHDWVNVNYPGTKLAITEYNWGGLEHINGALTQADVLGIFGREGLDLATLWNYPLAENDPLGYNNFESLPGAYAFRMYRNYDGNGSKFGETSVKAASADQSKLSVYASQRSADSAVTIIVINKTTSALNGDINLDGFVPSGSAKIFQYSSADLDSIKQLANSSVASTGFSYSFPANSITLFVIP